MALVAAQMAGDQLPPADIENQVLVVIPTEFRPHFPNANTKPGEESPAIICHVAHLNAPGGGNVIYRGVVWWNTLLVSGLKRQLGQSILGQMIKGQGQTGKNPPWILKDIMDQAGWVQYAEAWLATTEGADFEKEGQRLAAQNPVGQAPAAAAAPAVPTAPPAPAGPPAPPAAPPVNAPAPAPVAAPAAAPAPVAAAPQADMAAALAAMPEAERAALLAVLNNQGQAAH